MYSFTILTGTTEKICGLIKKTLIILKISTKNKKIPKTNLEFIGWSFVHNGNKNKDKKIVKMDLIPLKF